MWDGHTASAAKTAETFQSQFSLDEQIKKLHNRAGLTDQPSNAPGPQIGPGITQQAHVPTPLAAGLSTPGGGTAYAGATISAAPTGPTTKEYISTPYDPSFGGTPPPLLDLRQVSTLHVWQPWVETLPILVPQPHLWLAKSTREERMKVPAIDQCSSAPRSKNYLTVSFTLKLTGNLSTPNPSPSLSSSLPCLKSLNGGWMDQSSLYLICLLAHCFPRSERRLGESLIRMCQLVE